jgi:hypothetical protein
MSTLNWQWYVGYSDESYSGGPYDTREEAVQIAKEEFDGGYIVEAYKLPIDLARHFEVDRFLEDFEDNNYELGNFEEGGPIIDITKDQAKDLEEMVRNTIADWQKKHNLVFMPWAFTDSRNEEFIRGEMADTEQPGSKAD